VIVAGILVGVADGSGGVMLGISSAGLGLGVNGCAGVSSLGVTWLSGTVVFVPIEQEHSMSRTRIREATFPEKDMTFSHETRVFIVLHRLAFLRQLTNNRLAREE
jgi:hypothetical protein